MVFLCLSSILAFMSQLMKTKTPDCEQFAATILDSNLLCSSATWGKSEMKMKLYLILASEPSLSFSSYRLDLPVSLITPTLVAKFRYIDERCFVNSSESASNNTFLEEINKDLWIWIYNNLGCCKEKWCKFIKKINRRFKVL